MTDRVYKNILLIEISVNYMFKVLNILIFNIIFSNITVGKFLANIKTKNINPIWLLLHFYVLAADIFCDVRFMYQNHFYSYIHDTLFWILKMGHNVIWSILQLFVWFCKVVTNNRMVANSRMWANCNLHETFITPFTPPKCLMRLL